MDNLEKKNNDNI